MLYKIFLGGMEIRSFLFTTLLSPFLAYEYRVNEISKLRSKMQISLPDLFLMVKWTRRNSCVISELKIEEYNSCRQTVNLPCSLSGREKV